LVAAGAVLIALFGAMSEPSHTLDQLLMLLGHRQFLIWLFGSFVVVGAILIVIWLQERVTSRHGHRSRLILGLAYGSVSGILSAHTLLLAKSAVELIVRSIFDGINQFNRWQSWMILLGLVVLALSQLYFLHRGLRLCSTSVLYPFVFCIYNIVAILDGLIYFRQTSRISVLHACLVALGTVVLLVGVFALSWRLGPEYQAEDSADADTKALARVQTSHGALTPGLGLVETEEPLLPPHEGLDDEPSETSPLLRSRTTPALYRISRAPTAGSRRSLFRPPRVRRLTVPEESTNLWDELNNDSNESSRFSGALSPQLARSPSTSKMLGSAPSPWGRKHRRTPTGSGLSLRTPSATAKSLFGSVRWPTWGRGALWPARPDDVTESTEVPPQEGSEGDETDEAEGTVRRYPARAGLRGSDRSRSDGQVPLTGSGNWFRLRWWKKGRRWRWDHEERGEEDG
jgi:magnesium transporter